MSEGPDELIYFVNRGKIAISLIRLCIYNLHKQLICNKLTEY